MINGDAQVSATTHPRKCACTTSDGCHVCFQCIEQHCRCGKSTPMLCSESRPCNCVHVKTCTLCLGCRQPMDSKQYSHCRCVQHQEKFQSSCEQNTSQTRHCQCHLFRSHPSNADEGRQHRLRGIKRKLGISSSTSLYTRKVVLTDSDSSDNEVGMKRSTFDEDTCDAYTEHEQILQRPRRSQLLQRATGPQSIQVRGRRTSYLESLRLENGTQQLEMKERLTHETAFKRLFSNVEYTQDRDKALPSYDMVDYVVGAASLKAADIPELLGAFDDTAAVALGIVLEEYMKQISDLPLPSYKQPIQASIQAYSRLLLRGFDWDNFLTSCGSSHDLSHLNSDQQQEVAKRVANLILDEWLTCHSAHTDGLSVLNNDRSRQWIYDSVLEEIEVATQPLPLSTNTREHVDTKLTVRTSGVTGASIYKYHTKCAVGDHHFASVVVDGFACRNHADMASRRVVNTLEKEQARWRSIEQSALQISYQDVKAED